MRRYIGYREFVQRDQRSLVGTALLLTGSHEQAIRLTLWSLRAVGLSWPPTLWENSTTHAHITLYRRFLHKPTAAGATALVRLPPRQRLLVVACLHDGRTHAEMATVLGIPVETVESEITEAVAVLTKGNVARLKTRLATAAGEASVPDLTAQSMRALRRRRNRGAFLTAATVFLSVCLVTAFVLFPQGEVWNSALGERSRPPATEAPEAVGVISSPAPRPGLQPWQAPRTSFAIRYAVPGKCPGGDPAGGEAVPSQAGKVTCAGWTLKLAGGGTGGSALGSVKCAAPDRCESTVSVPDAAERLAHGDGRGSWRLSPAVSPDGHRIGYLSAAEGRYVAHDLHSGVKRYLSPVLTPSDTATGTRVSVSPNGRHFTVELGSRRLRTDFATGTVTPLPAGQATAAEKAADWLRRSYRVWRDSPSGRHAAAIGTEASETDSLHIVDARSRQVFKRLRLPSPGGPAKAEVVGWLNSHEVVVKMAGTAAGRPAGFFRMDAVTGKTRRVTGLADDSMIVLGAVTTP
ncbi:sigma factor-like helix-turn-helix DNA-binding protein [Streptosporangium roseum]|uniref:RNA polymerase, sigma-24 subunit, ECF subfamily n=1 Tax=Streptosporangium roseum (strain ATCC 12428 / DSM 43021 / JCM 3005 / KCTC 9067 / NCIMB 10171 / NRRL 2505 / NI 9100) TaxID=479432 RepID=D2BD12_STRRD|nr:sigma factor-like helix-turn-helix DNA-binding protein [Streptosporangium roseum]ACZ84253.1 RNA polymerase, sigma-24 subunit, ECF subfamily [Streptosporangium roseum DSM 43021]